MINNSGHTLYLYRDANCAYYSMVGGGGLFPGTRYNLSIWNAKNDISSIQIAGFGSDCISRDQSWAWPLDARVVALPHFCGAGPLLFGTTAACRGWVPRRLEGQRGALRQ